MITGDGRCVPYVSMVKSVLSHSSVTRKPTVLIFDCHYHDGSLVQIESVMRSFTDQLGPDISDAVVCFSFLSLAGSGNNNSLTGTFTAELANAIRQYSHLFITD